MLNSNYEAINLRFIARKSVLSGNFLTFVSNLKGMILTLETSTPICSVALHRGDDLLGYSEVFTEKSHSEVLTIMIANLLAQCKVGFADLEAVAVSKGPGSYTGLRIGVSTAKGICYALDIPLVAVDTLQSLSAQIQPHVLDKSVLFCPMLDARRMEVYVALHAWDLSVRRASVAMILDENSFGTELESQKIHFFGNGSAKFRAICTHPNAIFWDNYYPCAKFVGGLVAQNQGEKVDTAYFEPFYLKPFFTKPAKKIALGNNLPISEHH